MSRMICLFNEAAKPMVIRPVSIAAFSFYRNETVSYTHLTETIESKGQYLLHTLGGKLFVPSGEPLENYRVVTEGNVYYTDGSSAVTELGNLIFEPDSRVNTVAEVVSVSSGSEGKSEMVVRMKSAAALKVKMCIRDRKNAAEEISPGTVIHNPFKAFPGLNTAVVFSVRISAPNAESISSL